MAANETGPALAGARTRELDHAAKLIGSPDSARQRTRQERWRERNPVAYWAHMATRSALKRGLLTKQPCEVCGNPKSEAHHDDYLRPLTVRWLCRLHHKATHARGRRA